MRRRSRVEALTTEPAGYNGQTGSLDGGRWPPPAASGPACLLKPPVYKGLSLASPSTSSAGRSRSCASRACRCARSTSSSSPSPVAWKPQSQRMTLTYAIVTSGCRSRVEAPSTALASLRVVSTLVTELAATRLRPGCERPVSYRRSCRTTHSAAGKQGWTTRDRRPSCFSRRRRPAFRRRAARLPRPQEPPGLV